jgi:hypothetical protein
VEGGINRFDHTRLWFQQSPIYELVFCIAGPVRAQPGLVRIPSGLGTRSIVEFNKRTEMGFLTSGPRSRKIPM